MEKSYFKIGKTPCALWGEASDKVYLYVHGKGGDREEAAGLAEIAREGGLQTLSVDLPEHGTRKDETDAFYPWVAVDELSGVLDYAKERFADISLMAVSIGAWFSMLAYQDYKFERCLFVSPLLDMNALIGNMMNWAGVSVDTLRERNVIKTDFGETLSWKYYLYAKQRPIVKWDSPTQILYADGDNLTSRETANEFCARFKAGLTVMRGGEHWFHTSEQLEFLREWTYKNFQK